MYKYNIKCIKYEYNFIFTKLRGEVCYFYHDKPITCTLKYYYTYYTHIIIIMP